MTEQDPTLKSEESVAQQNSTPSWIQKVEEQSARDARVQPWLALMSDELNGPENDGKDLIRVERSIAYKPMRPALTMSNGLNLKLERSSSNDRPREHQQNPIRATLKFLKWQKLYETEKPFELFVNVPDHVQDKRTTNLCFEDVVVDIHDIRKTQVEPNLDEQGFVFRSYGTAVIDFEDRKAVEEVYLPEVEILLRQELKEVGRVFFFDWRLRKNAPEVEGSIIDLNDLTEWLRPAIHVHVDQSPAAVLKRVRQQLHEESAQLLQARVRVLNVWRPLIDSVQDWPLAIADGSTIEAGDLIEADHVRRRYTGSTMYLKANPRQQFYYASNQSKDEVLIFKNFDSDQSQKAKCAPHASFRHPQTPATYTPRQSIEVRALVFDSGDCTTSFDTCTSREAEEATKSRG